MDLVYKYNRDVVANLCSPDTNIILAKSFMTIKYGTFPVGTPVFIDDWLQGDNGSFMIIVPDIVNYHICDFVTWSQSHFYIFDIDEFVHDVIHRPWYSGRNINENEKVISVMINSNDDKYNKLPPEIKLYLQYIKNKKAAEKLYHSKIITGKEFKYGFNI